MRTPKAIQELINALERLPGIGPKTAQRLTFYLLHVPQEMLESFAQALVNLKKNTVLCSLCFNVAEQDPCPICASQGRDHGVICVVQEPLDLLALEKSGQYRGVYHVLHGAISPLNNIGPDELRIGELRQRLKLLAENGESSVGEIILALNTNVEGEATAMYLASEIHDLKGRYPALRAVRLTRLGQGMPTGADLEYADERTLRQALEGRREYEKEK